MNLKSRVHSAVVAVLMCAILAHADQKADQKKDKPAPSQTVDTGSFGVFVKGQRVVTETFTVRQQNGSSVIKSEVKETAGASPVEQKSSLEITGASELLRYEWSQSGGGSLMVLPNNEFLMEKITATPSSKPAEQAFLMPNTSMILDNNFFVQREVLVWRYLAVAPCKGDSSKRECQPVEFGALVPQDRTSLRVRLELVGKEKIAIRGVERELLRLNLHGESFDWVLWVDDHDQFKLMRVAIPADNTEVVRD